MVFVLDNYDSFTYNLVQYLGELGAEVMVRRNDQVTVNEIVELRPDRILISPGPCTPAEAGVSVELIRQAADKFPILGVCLGHQSIGAAFGGTVLRARTLMHGKTSHIQHDGRTVFAGLPSPMEATRYHSLIVSEENLPPELEISAHTTEADGSTVIMGLRHRRYPVEGVQFHPESVLTEHGKDLLRNFLSL
jgi:anthranilate synthase/aminodeoxychorismate synthase-like glutamine amidotransferase